MRFPRNAWTLAIVSFGVIGVVASYAAAQWAGERRLAKRLNTLAPNQFFISRIVRGMKADGVVTAIPAPDRMQFFSDDRGSVIRSLYMRFRWHLIIR